MVDLILGVHSIAHALQNPRRSDHCLFATQRGLKELKREFGQFDMGICTTLSPHDFQEKAKKVFKRLRLEYQRPFSQVFLLTSPLPEFSPEYLYQKIEERGPRPLRLIALDGVTDIHNAAAIFRTAAFYRVDVLITGNKGAFGRGPGFSRVSSGAVEYLPLVRCKALPSFLAKLRKKGVICLGLGPRAEKTHFVPFSQTSLCLVVGAEDKGLSQGVVRVLDEILAIRPQEGPISSLNVSVAAAVAMDRIFGL